jgi:hypothetical protein
MVLGLLFNQNGSRFRNAPQSIDAKFKAGVVTLILQNQPEIALEVLSERYSIRTPHIRVGRAKRFSSSQGAYAHSKNTIYVSSSDALSDPRIVLHEFYHHLRSISAKHKGTERYANRFADDFIASYIEVTQRLRSR